MTTLKTANPADMETLRNKALKDSETCAEKERWGLFSQPPPLGLGNMDYEVKHHPKDENGVAKSGPSNFYTGPPLAGKSSDVYFDPSNFLNKEKFKDPYFDYTKIHTGMKNKITKFKYDKDGNIIKPEPFYPAKTKWAEYKSPEDKQRRFGVPYENKADCPIKITKCRKDQDGRVNVDPPNILQFPLRGGSYNSTFGHTINKFPKYTAEPYDIGRHAEYVKEKKWQECYKAKDSGYFRSMSAGPYKLNKDKTVYGNRPPLGPAKSKWKYNGLKHEDAWRPSNPNKFGKNGTFDKFMRIIPNPAAIHKSKRVDRDPNRKESFFPSRNELSKPSPSITLNRMNIRSAVRG